MRSAGDERVKLIDRNDPIAVQNKELVMLRKLYQVGHRSTPGGVGA